MEDIILLGIGGHAHSVVDSIEQAGRYNIVGFLDRKELLGTCYRDYRVLGTDLDMCTYYDRGVKNAFITVGFLGQGDIRNRLYTQLKDAGYTVPNIIDKTAVVSENAELAEGIFVGKRAVINAEARIERMCIVNTGAVVEHDCIVKEFSHISVASILCGNVEVGQSSFVGAGATVLQGLCIGNRCVIGAGTTVRKNVEDHSMMRDDKIVKMYRGGV